MSSNMPSGCHVDHTCDSVKTITSSSLTSAASGMGKKYNTKITSASNRIRAVGAVQDGQHATRIRKKVLNAKGRDEYRDEAEALFAAKVESRYLAP